MDELSSQLVQMKAALEHAADEDKPGIQMIIDQLEELVGASACPNDLSGRGGGGVDNLEGETGTSSSSNDTGGDEDDEYKLFQNEIAALSSDNKEDDESPESNCISEEGNSASASDGPADGTSIGNELEALIGMKCLAPHQENWGQIGFYCAMVSSVLSLEGGEAEIEPDDLSGIMVRVIFLQPVVKSQLLCPFYKDDRCKFSDQDCKFSHGEIVPLSQLREYSEPDYATIVPGCRVLAKYHDNLWYKATVQRITEEGECEISYDVGNEALILPLHETCPLNNAEDASSDIDSSSEDDVENPGLSSDSEVEIPKSFFGDGMLDMRGNSALGEWEKYTKGIGSKLMVKMGYVMGTGLGRDREGRVEPVDAIVLPPGKSLDACMELKEKAKDGNLFSAEKRRLKHQRKVEKQRAKLAAQKPKKEANVFEFLNSRLALRKDVSKAANHKESSDLHKQSCSNLNKQLFSLDESIKQITKDIVKTKDSMKRHKGRDKETYSIMEKKLDALESKRKELNSIQSNIANEKKHRSDKRKLVLF